MTQLKNMNKKATEIADKKFKSLLLDGNWKETEYKKTDFGESYSMFAYSEKRAQFMKAVNDLIINSGFEFGLWQNARNKNYLDAVSSVTAGITPEAVDSSGRFKTMWD